MDDRVYVRSSSFFLAPRVVEVVQGCVEQGTYSGQPGYEGIRVYLGKSLRSRSMQDRDRDGSGGTGFTALGAGGNGGRGGGSGDGFGDDGGRGVDDRVPLRPSSFFRPHRLLDLLQGCI